MVKYLDIFGLTIWLTEFCQHFGIKIITPAHTLSYFGIKADQVFCLYSDRVL